MIVKRKLYSTVPHYAIGAGIGALVGAGSSYYKGRKKDKHSRLRSTITGASLGAGLGAGVVAAGKYGKRRYDKFIGFDKNKNPETIDISKYKPGDLIIADRGFMKHYGVVVDNKGTIIEYGSKKRDPRMASYRKVNISEFKGNSPIYTEVPSGKYTREEIVKRANSRLSTDSGIYNLRNNNCEHFARDVVNGERVSTQVDNILGKKGNFVVNKIKSVLTPKNFSNPANGMAMSLLEKQSGLLKNKILNSKLLFKLRGNLTKELGGLSHFDKYQTHYIAGGSSLGGSIIGSAKAKKKAKKDAENYGLKKGSLEYDNFLKSRTREGALKGAVIGGGAGYGISKGIDTARGKVIADKMKVKYGIGLDKEGRNYMKFGKNMRGINSEKQVETIANNYRELGDFAKNFYRAL